MSVPNQKRAIISQREKRDKNHLFATMNLNALQEAMKNLKGNSGFKLWCYFNKNQDQYEFELSQKACEEWGIKKDSYYNGVNELINKGYLHPICEGSNVFCFYESAREEIDIKDSWFSEDQNSYSDGQKLVSSKAKTSSEKPERNITNNTETNNYNTDFNDEDFEEILFQKSQDKLEEIKRLEKDMNQSQKIKYAQMRCKLDRLSPVNLDKTKWASIINETYNNIMGGETNENQK